MAKYSDDDQAVVESAEDSIADNAMPYAIGSLGQIDFGENVNDEEADNVADYEEIDPEASVEDAANGKKKSSKAKADDAITASALGAYKDPFLDALAYDRPETDGLSPGYE